MQPPASSVNSWLRVRHRHAEEQAIRDALHQALETAQHTQRPQMVRVWDTEVVHLSDVAHTPWVYYREPRLFEITGFGSAWHAAAPQLSALAGDIRTMCTSLIDIGHPDSSDFRCPLFFGGSAFAPRIQPMKEPWAAWPSAALFVPAVMQISTREQQYRVRTVIAYPDSIFDELETRLAVPIQNNHSLASNAAPYDCGVIETMQEWSSRIEKAKCTMRQTSLEKVVLARGHHHHVPKNMSVAAACKQLAKDHSNCGIFAVSLHDGCFFMGASPEVLVEQHHNVVTAHAVAGTLPEVKMLRRTID